MKNKLPNNFKKDLQQLGLSAKEAEVYLSLLKLGPATVRRLIEVTGYKRGDLHYVLDKLEKRKLVYRRPERNRFVVQAESPWRLRELLQSQAEVLSETEKQLQSLLPNLTSQFVLSTEKPSIRYLEGLEGMKQLYDEIVLDKKELLLFTSDYDRDDKELNEVINKAIKQQFRAGIKVRALVPYFPELDSSYFSYTKKHGIKSRVLPRQNFVLDSQIAIWGDKVAMTSIKDQIVTTVIDNKNIAQTMRTIFELIWNFSEPLQKKYLVRANRQRSGKFKKEYL
jgi:HTH-type transcriptional regulator, sugar sensing transcriptional regulator